MSSSPSGAFEPIEIVYEISKIFLEVSKKELKDESELLVTVTFPWLPLLELLPELPLELLPELPLELPELPWLSARGVVGGELI